LKMGWKNGDGLGANCHGMSEPIKPKINTESRGLGYDQKQDPWVAHNEEFEQLLKNLNSNSDGEGSKEKGDVAGEGEDVSGITKHALENKSKGSRSRIHYQKFVKNKDLSKASLKDMSCIFGRSLEATVQLLPTSVMESPEISDEPKVNGESFDIMTEITDEQAIPEDKNKKRRKKKKNKKERDDNSSSSPTEEESIQPDNPTEETEDLESVNTERKKKKKKRKQKDLEDESVIEDNLNHQGIKSEELQTESINDKNGMDQDEPAEGIKKKKKKSKKRKREDEDEEIHQPIPDTTQVEIESTTSVENADPEEPEPKKKKKKSKKSRRDPEEILDEVANVAPDVNTDAADLPAEPQKEEEPNKDPPPPESVEKLGSMQFINRGSIVDYFRNKRLQMLNRTSVNVS